VFRDELYVVDGTGRVAVFPAGADGDATPARAISGAVTKLARPMGAFVF
jgi:hypothetical protein